MIICIFRPVYLLCGSCGFEFNYILKFENISIEEKLFTEMIGVSGKSHFMLT